MPRSNGCWSGVIIVLALPVLLVCCSPPAPLLAQDDMQQPETIEGPFSIPESVAFDSGGRVYASNIGEFNPNTADGDGFIVQLDAQGNVLANPFASGLNDPKGIAFDTRGRLVVSDLTRLVRFTADGELFDVIEPAAFPRPPEFLNDVAASQDGSVWVSDSSAGNLFRIAEDGAVTLEEADLDGINGLLFDASGTLLIAADSEILQRRQAGVFEPLAQSFNSLDGLAFDADGNLYASEFSAGRVTRIAANDGSQELLVQAPGMTADIGINPVDNVLWAPTFRGNSLLRLPLGSPAGGTEQLTLTINPASGPLSGNSLTVVITLQPLSLLDASSLRLEVGESLSLDLTGIAGLLAQGVGRLDLTGEQAILTFAGLPFPVPGLPVPLRLSLAAASVDGDVASVEREYRR